MAAWEALLKPSLDLLKSGLELAKRESTKKHYEKLLSEIVRELLKGSPDFDLLEAKWGELKKLGVLPTRTFVRARKLYGEAMKHRDVKTLATPRPERKTAAKKVVKRPAKG